MTAFASRTGSLDRASWAWELRGVNARGLDLRIRVPDGIEGLEPAVRAALGQRFSRGNLTIGLHLSREDSAQALTIDPAQLDRVLAAFDQVQNRAFDMGVTLAQPTAADVLSQRGVVIQSQTEEDSAPLLAALLVDLDLLLTDFAAMRLTEGTALSRVIVDQLDQIAAFTEAAATAALARKDETAANFTAALRRVVDTAPEMDPARIAQELAVLAVKSDITEEIDRLRAHVAAARTLLKDKAPTGRKLDFLAQEFNREANTLCSKAQSTGLTAIGLDLKAVIDQMREQIQNVE